MSLAKERELSPEPRKIDLLLDECVHLLQKEAESRGVALVRELRAGDTLLMLDAREFQRAIMNVLLNALEACPPGGRVRMFSRLTATACEVEVRDDGPGMDRAQLERVFEPYYTTKPGGTGLGLSITRGIIEEHGGAIEMSSIEGTGCQVLITLPLTRAGVR
jgi:signal transduction histidine kinase